MAKSSITEASRITVDIVLTLSKFYGSQDLRTLQAKLTSTTREIRGLTSGKFLPGRIGENLSFEQAQILRDAAALIESVNSKIEHAKEKLKRREKEAKLRQKARTAQARHLVADTFPMPHDSMDQCLDILKTALTFNRAACFRGAYLPQEFNLNLRSHLSPATTKRLIGWNGPQAYWKSTVLSFRHELLQAIEDEIAYDDGSTIQDRLNALKQKVADRLAQVRVSTDEEETLHQWSQALSPASQQEEA